MYRVGYRFAVYSTKVKEEFLPPRLYSARYRDRGPDAAPIAFLQDGDIVEVVDNIDGAVKVRCLRTGEIGFLG